MIILSEYLKHCFQNDTFYSSKHQPPTKILKKVFFFNFSIPSLLPKSGGIQVISFTCKIRLHPLKLCIETVSTHNVPTLPSSQRQPYISHITFPIKWRWWSGGRSIPITVQPWSRNGPKLARNNGHHTTTTVLRAVTRCWTPPLQHDTVNYFWGNMAIVGKFFFFWILFFCYLYNVLFWF